MTNRWRVCLSLLAAVVLLASCRGEGQGPEPGATPPSPTTAAITPSPTVSPLFEPDADVLDVAVGDPATLDPLRIQDPASVLIARQLYEGLTRWDPVEERVLPAAAESWEVSNGGRRFTFRLRLGMSFHDGSPVVSRDFSFAFNRIARKRNASDLAYTLERVRGFVEVNQLGDSDSLAGIRTPDDRTVVIELSEPFYDLPVVLTHPALVPLPRRAVADIDSFLTMPIGNGPFRMAREWSSGQPVVLEAFPGFIETPRLDGIIFLPYPDASASWIPFLEERLDVAEVPAGQFEAARDEFGEAGFKPLLAGYYYGLNVRSGPLRDRRVRKAITFAVNRDNIHTSIYKGTMQTARGIVPDGMPGFEENVCTDLCNYAPEKAERLAKGLPKRKREVALEYTKGRPHGAVAAFVEEDLEAIGMDVRDKSFRFRKYLRRLRDGKQQAYRLGWIAEYPAPAVFLESLFESDSPDNHSGFSSGAVDRLLRRAAATRSDPKRTQLYREAEEMILRRAPIVPIGSFLLHWAIQPWVRGLEFDVTGGFDAAGVSIEP